MTQDKQAISSLTNGKAPKQTRKRRKETVKYALTGEDFPDVDDIVLVKVLHPLYVCSRIFGMIWKEKEKFFDGKIFSFDLCTVHCFILLLTAWFNAFQFFASYDRTDVYGSVLFQKVSVHIFNFQLACGVTSFVFYHYRHMPNFIKLWENYKIRYGGVLLTSMRRTLTLKCIWINVVNIGLIVFFQLYLFIKDTHLFVLHNLPFFAHTSHESKIWLLIFFGLLHFYLFMAWIQSLINIICITKALRDEFSQLSQDLRDRLCEGAARSKWPLGHIASPPNFGKSNKQKERNQNNYQIEVYRQRHFELCKLVRIYDDVASSYLFFLYLFSIPVLVLVMYVLWGLDKDNFADNLSQLILSIISLVFFVAILISITVAATSLNIAVSILSWYYIILNLMKHPLSDQQQEVLNHPQIRPKQ